MEGSPTTTSVLVTGANSGLGFAICCRLIDEFLQLHPSPQQSLHLLFTTRDAKKSADTLRRLTAHLHRSTRSNGSADRARISLTGHLVHLTRLHTVKALADLLLSTKQPLDAVIWNAGIAGWKYLDYPRATWHILTGLVQATTYPRYMVCDVGALAKPQLPQTAGGEKEPVLGNVFTANVFGHYMLTHWISPLLRSPGRTPGRVIWIGSVSALTETFSADDVMGLRSEAAYESSKRVVDLLVLTSELKSMKKHRESFFDASEDDGTLPRMYVSHPGVVDTAIANVPWFITFFVLAATYIARWIGSPWHLVQPYKGAVSATWAALSPASQLEELEMREGKGKWGSACDVYGQERVARTEVEGWGFNGVLGERPSGSIATKRTSHVTMTKENREDFEVVAARVWAELEEMRQEWERRLGEV